MQRGVGRIGEAYCKRTAECEARQTAQILYMAGIGNDQRPANGVQRRKSVEILDRVVRFGFATDNEIPFDHIVGICSESIDIFCVRSVILPVETISVRSTEYR